VVRRALVRRLRPVGSGDHLIDGGAAAPARAVAVAAVEVSARAGAVQRRRGPKTRHAEGVRFARATGREPQPPRDHELGPKGRERSVDRVQRELAFRALRPPVDRRCIVARGRAVGLKDEQQAFGAQVLLPGGVEDRKQRADGGAEPQGLEQTAARQAVSMGHGAYSAALSRTYRNASLSATRLSSSRTLPPERRKPS